MELSITLFNQLLVMMVIALLGFIYSKLTKVTDLQQKFLSHLLLFFINPCVTINAYNIDFDKNKLIGLFISIVLSFLITFIMIFLSKVFFRKKSDENIIKRISVIFTNCGFVGIPLVSVVFGNEGVFYLMGYLVAFNITLWTYGYSLVTGEKDFKKAITNPNVIAVSAGIILFCLPVKLPSFFAKPVELIAGLNTAVSMILLGILFGGIKKEWIKKLFDTLKTPFSRDEKKSLRWKKIFSVLYTAFLRLVVFAFVSMCFSLLVILISKKIFADEKTMMYCTIFVVTVVVFIASLCPSAISVSSFACLFDKDVVFANFIVCLTHILSVITIPFFVFMLTSIADFF